MSIGHRRVVNTTQDVETTYVRSRSCCRSFIIVNLKFCPDQGQTHPFQNEFIGIITQAPQ